LPKLSGLVRISDELIPLIDKVIDTSIDEFGIKKFKSRKDLIDEAVKEFLKLNASKILETHLMEVPQIEGT